MSVAGLLASALGRNDEQPNIALAQRLAAEPRPEAVAELVGLLEAGTAAERSDAIKVLYELGELSPGQIAGHADAFVRLLGARNNRLAWGAMHAVATITPVRPETILAALPAVIAAADRGSVIARDHAMSTLARLAAAGHADRALPILLGRLEAAAANQFPMYAEFAAPVIDAARRERFRAILAARLPGLPPAKQNRVGRLLRRLG